MEYEWNSHKILIKFTGLNHSEEFQTKTKLRIWVENTTNGLIITPHKDDEEIFKRLTTNDGFTAFPNGIFRETIIEE